MSDAPPKGWQELGDEFHKMMGECIAAWAQVDDELFRIFSDCVGPYEQSAIIYFRTPGLDVRFSLTDESCDLCYQNVRGNLEEMITQA